MRFLICSPRPAKTHATNSGAVFCPAKRTATRLSAGAVEQHLALAGSQVLPGLVSGIPNSRETAMATLASSRSPCRAIGPTVRWPLPRT